MAKMRHLHFASGSLVANRFEIDEPVGSGGMGTIYRARDRYSGEIVALKLLHPNASGADEADRFVREAQILSEQRHPGIVAYIAHGKTPDGQGFLAMEWLDGEDLGQRLVRGSLSLPDCLLLVGQVADALALAHQRRVIHRDLKPTNLFLCGGDVARVKVLDFGIARRVTTSRAEPSELAAHRRLVPTTRTGMIVGTPEYMAPEQARGARDLTPAVDVFSLGCVLYECLTGQPPFVADQITAVLVRILFDEPAPIGERRLGIPAAVTELVGRMLAKDPARRPADAAALRAELAALGEARELVLPATLVSPKPPAAMFAGNEQSLFSVVLAAPPADEAGVAVTLRRSDLLQGSERQALLQLLQTSGVAADSLASGGLIMTVPSLGSAKDQAVWAARAALLLKERWPAAVVSIATGRGALRGHTAVGEVVELAARALDHGNQPSSHRPATGILVDGLSAKLLDGRFAQTPQPGGSMLLGEERDIDASRPLLGKLTPCIGRETELATLEAQLTACIEESESAAVLVLGPPGIGKSRLRHEFLRRLAKRPEPITCLVGRGDLMSAGAPYGMLRDAIPKLCGLSGSEPLATQRARLRARVAQHLALADQDRVVLFIGELCNISFPEEGNPLLQAARQEPTLMGDCLRQALRDWLAAECAVAPVLLVLDDLQWSDELTVSVINQALRDQVGTPLFVLSFARPEVFATFPKLWQDHHVHELQLNGLSKKSCERLIRQVLAADILPEIVARAVEQSAGNPLFLEELIRAIGEGKSADNPETVVAMLQTRIGQLAPGLRRVVRAASVFGQTFFGAGVAELLGGASEPSALDEIEHQLARLVDAEILERYQSSRLANQNEYRFRHPLVREAAYALLTESDLATGHQLASGYLLRLGLV